MPLARYQFTVVDDAGNVLPAASVEVRREVAGTPIVPLFADREGATPIGNPFAADADGFAAFHVAGGAYRITASKGGFLRTWRYVGIGLASELDTIAAGSPFVFSATTTDADPGAGVFRLNHATPASATAIYFDNLNALGADVSAWLDTFDNGGGSGNRGMLTLAAGDGSALLVATVTGSVMDGTGYRKVSITPLVTAGSFVEGQTLYLQFTQAGTNGIDGTTAGYPFNFDNSTSLADPGAGDFRLNNATLASVTAIAMDDQSAASGNPDVSAAVLSWDDSTSSVRGYLLIKSVAAPQNFAVYAITGASTDNSGWTQLAVTHVASSGSFTNGGACTFEFSRTGDIATIVGKQSIWIPASSMLPRITSGAAVGLLDSGVNDNTIPSLDFDQTTSEHAQFVIGMPKSWNEGTVTFTPYWTASAGSAAQTCIFTLSGVAISNDDSLDFSQGTPQSSSDALIATNDLHIGPESSAITIGGAPADGDLVVFDLARDISDTLAADARLIGIMLHITLNANTDA
jgi:hypothetical protein